MLRQEIDPEIVAATSQVAESRLDWEALEEIAGVANLDEEVNKPRAAREESSLSPTIAISPLEKGRMAAMTGRCVRVLRRLHVLPPVKISDEEQNRARRRRMLEEHLVTPAPELAGEDQRFVAAAALACQAELGENPDLQAYAADILFTLYPHEVQVAPELVASAAPALHQLSPDTINSCQNCQK